MQKKSKYIVLGLMFIIIGINTIIINKYKEYKIILEDKSGVACYLNDKKSNYIAVLEIPSINFIRGLTKENNVDKNISFIDYSVMPNEYGYTIIMGHSGNNINSYFNDLEQLNIGDFVYLYYDKTKYIYKTTNISLIEKTGKLRLKNDIGNTNKLLLITCKRNTNMQIVIECSR